MVQHFVPDAMTNDNAPYGLYYFFHPQCSHCAAFTPVWNKIKMQLLAKYGNNLCY